MRFLLPISARFVESSEASSHARNLNVEQSPEFKSQCLVIEPFGRLNGGGQFLFFRYGGDEKASQPRAQVALVQ